MASEHSHAALLELQARVQQLEEGNRELAALAVARREEAERLRLAVEAASFGLWDWDVPTHQVTLSPEWKRQLGYQPHEIRDHYAEWQDRVHPDDWPGTMRQLQACMAGRDTSFVLEFRMRHKNGTYRWINSRASIYRGPDGRPVRIIGCHLDFTDRRRVEEELREWRDRYDAAIRASGRIVYDWYAPTDHATFGGSVEATLGYAAGSMDGPLAKMMSILHPEDMAGFDAAVQRSLVNKRPFHMEYRLRHHAGHYVVIEDNGCPIFNAAGSVERVVGLLEDVTERKRAEEARTRLEAQLRQVQKMEALGTLAGGIAHDFNNILGVIVGSSELARRELPSGHPVQSGLDAITKAGARARDLVQQILTFSRQQAQERHVVQLREVTEESLRMLRATLPAGVELASDFAPDTPNVMADRTQIHQVLMNLCANAWQAIEGSTGRIDVKLAPAAVDRQGGQGLGLDLAPGRYARLSVADTGRGMDGSTMERIFDPFFTTKRQGEGTGLGLAVVDGIVKSHGGAIAVESEPGRGTVFRLYFPAVDEPAEAVPPRPEPPRGRGQRVLYLDDEEVLVLLMTRILELLGYRVSGFTQPEEALAALHDTSVTYDVLMTDLNMPGVSGLGVLAEFMRLRPGVPVALTSGYVADEERAQAQVLGVREILHKPNTVDQVAAAMQRLLGHGVPRPEASVRAAA